MPPLPKSIFTPGGSVLVTTMALLWATTACVTLGKVPVPRDVVVVGAALAISAALVAMLALQRRCTDISRLERSTRQMYSFVSQTLEAVPVAVQIKDANLRYVWVNQQHAVVTGYPRSKTLGKTWDEVTSLTAHRPEPLVDEHDLWEGRRTILEVERRFPATPRMTERRLLVTKVPLQNAAGDVERILTLGTDITALMQARAEADIANRLVEGILRHVPLSIQVKDTDLRFRWANHIFCQTVDRDLSDVLGKRMEELPLSAKSADHRTNENPALKP